jgi:proteasome accessory factor A
MKPCWILKDEVGDYKHEEEILRRWGRGQGFNGCVVYNDLGYLEICTPSYGSSLDSIIYDKASEVFAWLGAKSAGEYFLTSRFKPPKKVVCYKSNISISPLGRWVSYATHGNFLVRRRACNLKRWKEVEKALVPYMVTRILFTGAGGFVGGELAGFPAPKFVISPRAMFLRRISSHDTMFERGLLNTRDEPHADPAKYWRLHDINFEGLRNEYSIFLRDSLQSLVISALERGLLSDAPKISDPLLAIRDLSKDTQACEWKVKLKGGKKADALEIFGFYLGKIEQMLSDSASEKDKLAFGIIKGTHEKLRQRSLECLVDGLDWVTKKELLEIEQPRSGEEALALMNQYSMIDETTLFYLGKKVNFKASSCYFDPRESLTFVRDAIPRVNWAELQKKISLAMLNPPPNTRDYFKCKVLRKFKHEVKQVSWGKIGFKNFIFNLAEPFMLSKEESEELIKGADDLRKLALEVKKIYPKAVRGSGYEI